MNRRELLISRLRDLEAEYARVEEEYEDWTSGYDNSYIESRLARISEKWEKWEKELGELDV